MKRLVKGMVFGLIVTLLLSTSVVYAAQTSMRFELDYFDLETGLVVPKDPHSAPEGTDFQYLYNADWDPHSVVWINNGAMIAYSEEGYSSVAFDDISNLDFLDGSPTSEIDVPFDMVVVILTSDGNYYKMELVDEDEVNLLVTFEWEQLISQQPNSKGDTLSDRGVPGEGLEDAPGQERSFNPDSQADEHAGQK